MSTMMTITGRLFDPLELQVEDVDIEDIAHGLAFTCRYGGHVSRFYSVAEHCVLMSHWVAPEHALGALLHDASEAYLGDIIRPLKDGLPDYREVEFRAEWVIAQRFGLEVPLHPSIKEADTRIIADERQALVPHQADFPSSRVPLGVKIKAWGPSLAKEMYLLRYYELTRPTLRRL